MGFDNVQLHTTRRHPIVTAERLGQDAPTLLIYGHFDVQPVDPLEQWQQPPFEPQVIGNKLYARGASDDKGQAYALLAALQSYLETSGQLPVNIKILLEGEEEISSPSFPAFLQANAEALSCDAILIADQDMLDPEHPVIMFGLRGSLYIEIEIRGPSHDLHSGTFGGTIDNPFNVLTRLLASFQDGDNRRILLPGFYDNVKEINQDERTLIAQAPITETLALNLTGVPALGGEAGYSLAERISVRPTFDIHGIIGGFTGEGKKTVIPSKATAKFSMRLVPDQSPDKIALLLNTHIKNMLPPSVDFEFRILGKARPVKVDLKAPAVQAAAQAYRLGFNAEPVYLRGGGSIPIVREMIDSLTPAGQADVPVVMIGFGLPDDRTHSPNEKFHLPNFYRGIDTVIYYLSLFAQL
jgi:acetylornithine deacetylase/succinyl-diaminopimelate desuccinylase-like protein